MRRGWPAVLLVLALVACGSDRLSQSEYATESEALVTDLITGIAALDSEWEAQEPTVDGARAYWTRRLALRSEFLQGITDLSPPEGLGDIHEFALDLFSRLLDAEEALAARANSFETLTEHGPWWDTPEGQAARAVDAEAVALCHAAQEEFDATEQREAVSDVPWIPSDMKQVIRVAFGCPPAED